MSLSTTRLVNLLKKIQPLEVQQCNHMTDPEIIFANLIYIVQSSVYKMFFMFVLSQCVTSGILLVCRNAQTATKIG